MNVQKFTQKSMEAIQLAQNIATEHDNQQIEQCHILLALLMQENGLVPQLLTKMGITVPSFISAAQELVAQLPAVTGSGREVDKVYINRDVDSALTEAENVADSMKDDFVSVEHILLGLIAKANSRMKKLFETYGIDSEKTLQTLQSIRGSARVTTDNPEGTYDALNKYGTDLVKQAREMKRFEMSFAFSHGRAKTIPV